MTINTTMDFDLPAGTGTLFTFLCKSLLYLMCKILYSRRVPTPYGIYQGCMAKSHKWLANRIVRGTSDITVGSFVH